MGCPAINGLQLSRESQSALKEIQSKVKFGKLLQITVSVGIFESIFSKKDIPSAMINIRNTDWDSLSQILQGVTDATRYEIRKIAMTQVLRTQGGGEYVFWQAVYDMCLFSK